MKKIVTATGLSALVAFVALAQHFAPASAAVKPFPQPTCPPVVSFSAGHTAPNPHIQHCPG